MPSEDEFRQQLRQAGFMDPKAHQDVEFDWDAWRDRVGAAHLRPERRRTLWGAVAVLFFAALVVIPVASRLSSASDATSESPYQMGRLIGLRLGDPFTTHITWKKTAHGWILRGTADQSFYASSRAESENRGYTDFEARIGTKRTVVTLSGINGFPFQMAPRARVVLGPAPAVQGTLDALDVSAGNQGISLNEWASTLALYAGHPQARASATLTTLGDTHVEMKISQWLLGPTPAVLLSLRQGRWHRQYVVSAGGVDRVADSVHVSGYHWFWPVDAPSRSVNLSDSAKRAILKWAQHFWGQDVTGYRYAKVTRPLMWPDYAFKSAIEVQFLSVYGPMNSPVYFSQTGKEAYWVRGVPFTYRALSTAMASGSWADAGLSLGTPPITLFLHHYVYGRVPERYEPLPPPTVSIGPHAGATPLVSALLHTSVKTIESRGLGRGHIRHLTVTHITPVTQSDRQVTIHLAAVVNPAFGTQTRGTWAVLLTWQKVRGHWRVEHDQWSPRGGQYKGG